jgi:hypothetical protein
MGEESRMSVTPATLSAALCEACAVAGGLIWANAARQFDSLEDLDLFRRDLSRRGLLTSDAMAAVKERREQLGRGR